MGCGWTFQQVNDPKHTSKSTHNGSSSSKIKYSRMRAGLFCYFFLFCSSFDEHLLIDDAEVGWHRSNKVRYVWVNVGHHWGKSVSVCEEGDRTISQHFQRSEWGGEMKGRWRERKRCSTVTFMDYPCVCVCVCVCGIDVLNEKSQSVRGGHGVFLGMFFSIPT